MSAAGLLLTCRCPLQPPEPCYRTATPCACSEAGVASRVWCDSVDEGQVFSYEGVCYTAGAETANESLPIVGVTQVLEDCEACCEAGETGACCTYGPMTCHDNYTALECDAENGVFFPNESCDDISCNPCSDCSDCPSAFSVTWEGRPWYDYTGQGPNCATAPCHECDVKSGSFAVTRSGDGCTWSGGTGPIDDTCGSQCDMTDSARYSVSASIQCQSNTTTGARSFRICGGLSVAWVECYTTSPLCINTGHGGLSNQCGPYIESECPPGGSASGTANLCGGPTIAVSY